MPKSMIAGSYHKHISFKRNCQTVFQSGYTILYSNQLCMLLLLSHFSRVWLRATPSLGFSRQEHWSGLPFPSPVQTSEKGKWSRSVMSDSSKPQGLQPTRLLRPWDFPGKSTGVGCHCLLCQQCIYGPGSLHPHHFLVVLQFVILAILIGV